MTDTVRLEVRGDVEVAQVREALRRALTGRPAEALAGAELVATELVTNALLHGGGVAGVSITPLAGGVRIEVADRNVHVPIVAMSSSEAMTGRGLHLVARTASHWGVERSVEGKIVWAEVSDVAHGAVDQSEDELLALWDDLVEDDPRTTVGVSLGQVPTDLLVGAKRHVDNLVREFALAAGGERSGTTHRVPAPLLDLIDRVVHQFQDARLEIKRQATAAARAGEAHTFLELDLPLDAAEAAAEYLAALDEADAYCRANRLLTLETPPQHRVFRHWYIGEIVKQLHAARKGAVPPAIVPFEQRLLQEVDAAETARRAAERAVNLYSVAMALAAATTADEVAASVLRDAVTALDASGGGLVLAADHDQLVVPGTVGYDEPVVERLRAESRFEDLPAATAVRTGEAVWVETVEERDARFPSLAAIEPETAAICAVPVVAGDRVLGALRFSFRRSRLFDEQERQFVQALAAETAEALQRAELLDREREIRCHLEKLASVGEAMLRRRDLDEILQLATDVATEVTGAAFGAFFYNRQGSEGGEYSLHTLSGVARDAFAAFPMPRPAEIFGPTLAGIDVVRVDDVAADLQHGSNPPYSGVPEGHLLVRSYLAVPVTLSTGETVGGMFFGHPGIGRFGSDAEQLAVGVAGQAAAAVENVRSHEERARVAATLQQSLLPATLPEIPGLDIAAVDSTGGEGLGGDFYDIFPLGPQRWGVAMGDVRGRGPEAAALTALIRYTIRTAALLERAPGEVLEVLNAALHADDDPERFSSAVYGVLHLAEAGTATFTYANGGHPPAAVVSDGEVSFLPPTGPLAGVMADSTYTVGVARLTGGDLLVLYTDGITEARAAGDEFGPAGLVKVLGAAQGSRAGVVADRVVAAARSFARTAANDDSAVFVLRME